jgi:hypothetical protein
VPVQVLVKHEFWVGHGIVVICQPWRSRARDGRRRQRRGSGRRGERRPLAHVLALLVRLLDGRCQREDIVWVGVVKDKRRDVGERV